MDQEQEQCPVHEDRVCLYEPSKPRLNTSILLTLAIFLVIQTTGAVWWASSITTAMSYVQTDISAVKVTMKESQADQNAYMQATLQTTITNTAAITILRERIVLIETQIRELAKKLDAH